MVEHRTDVARRMVWKRVFSPQGERFGIVVQQFPNEIERPRILVGRAHRGEPDLPVETRLVGSDLSRSLVQRDGLGQIGIVFPYGIVIRRVGISTLKDNGQTFVTDRAESAVEPNGCARAPALVRNPG